MVEIKLHKLMTASHSSSDRPGIRKLVQLYFNHTVGPIKDIASQKILASLHKLGLPAVGELFSNHF